MPMKKYLFLFFFSFLSNFSFAQDSLIIRQGLPNLYFDCEYCSQAFYRQEINYVNFVRDRRLADIYVLLTEIKIGSGGSEYKLFFIGEKKFAGQNDTLVFQSEPNVAEVKIREGILNIMKNGLLKYMLQTNLKSKIQYTIDIASDSLHADQVKDKWDFWTFNLNYNLYGQANSYSSNVYLSSNVSANRTTEKFRTETGGWYSLNKQRFVIDDSTTVYGMLSNLGAFHLLAFSIGKHFAVGHFATSFQSTQQNLKNSISYCPAIEYNVFKYEEASRRQLRFIYRLGANYQEYFEKTIYNKTSELYAAHSLVIQWSQIEKWGSLNLNAGGWHYFNYPSNYNMGFYPSINFNPLKGLRVGLSCGFSVVKNQFYLKASDVSPTDILLNQVQLKTNYNYNYGFNVSYTFGSKYNNVINVRFNLDENYW